MESLETLRRAAYELAAKRLGRDARQVRQFSLQLSAAESLPVIMALPVADGLYAPLQDPLTGELYFVSDASEIDGGEPIQ